MEGNIDTVAIKYLYLFTEYHEYDNNNILICWLYIIY